MYFTHKSNVTMSNRRNFLKTSIAAGAVLPSIACQSAEDHKASSIIKPVVISTWNHGIAANTAAWAVLNNGGKAIDAVEVGVRVTESDPTGQSVGIGGRPDMNGDVTLDACIMNEQGDCGSVAYLKNIEHPISVARQVMEETPHVMLVGDGAKQFALEKGHAEINLLTEQSRTEWLKWQASERKVLPKINEKIMIR